MDVPPPPGATENRPNVTPPRHSMPGDPQGPPLPPQPPWQEQRWWPTEPVPGSQAPPPAPLPAEASGAVYSQSALVGGNVGPVGSAQERDQLGRIVGGEPSTATVLLLGPVVRGMTANVVLEPEQEGGR